MDLILARRLIKAGKRAISSLKCLGRYGYAIGFSVTTEKLEDGVVLIPAEDRVCLHCPFKVDCHRMTVQAASERVYQLQRAGQLFITSELHRRDEISRQIQRLMHAHMRAGHQDRQKDITWDPT